jgi:hypothetical protein
VQRIVTCATKLKKCSAGRSKSPPAKSLLKLKTSRKIVDKVLGPQTYHPQQSNDWVGKICEDAVQQLSALGKPYKFIGSLLQTPLYSLKSLHFRQRLLNKRACLLYLLNIVTANVVQRGKDKSAGIHSTCSSYWDASMDGMFSLIYIFNTRL